MAITRDLLDIVTLQDAVESVTEKLDHIVARKGMGAMASNHEIYGIIVQETSEYEDAIHRRLSDEEKIEELKDIAAAAIFGIASIQSGGVDW